MHSAKFSKLFGNKRVIKRVKKRTQHQRLRIHSDSSDGSYLHFRLGLQSPAQTQLVKPQREFAFEISNSFPCHLSLSDLLAFGVCWSLAKEHARLSRSSDVNKYCLESSGNGAVTEGHARSHLNTQASGRMHMCGDFNSAIHSSSTLKAQLRTQSKNFHRSRGWFTSLRRYVCTANWMGLRWPRPSSCPWAPCCNLVFPWYFGIPTHTNPN